MFSSLTWNVMDTEAKVMYQVCMFENKFTYKNLIRS